MSNLKFNPQQYEVRTMTAEDRMITFRAFEKIVYVANPVDADHQCMNIYVPEVYYQGETINGYGLNTAPILLANNIGGYMPSQPKKPEQEMFGHTSTFFYALEHGYVVATPGARGRINRSPDGTFYGKAPACIVDLKAAVRYLKANEEVIPGDVNKMISNGTSAGGALSALLGASGNHPDFEPYLMALGAEDADDHIFAASCYCPVTDLEHADSAYEWEFKGINEFHRMHMRMSEGGRPQFTPVDGVMPPKKIELSYELAAQFPAYLNGLNLKDGSGTALTLDADGNGTFKAYILSKLTESAQAELNAGKSVDQPGVVVENGQIVEIDFDTYMKGITRMKEAPAFDDVSMKNFENSLFGNETEDFAHFTPFSYQRSEQAEPKMAAESAIHMMNPLHYLKQPSCNVAQHWRIRHGAKDRDIGFATPAIVGLTLQMMQIPVDYRIPWGIPHSGDYDLKDLFQWIDNICK